MKHTIASLIFVLTVFTPVAVGSAGMHEPLVKKGYGNWSDKTEIQYDDSLYALPSAKCETTIFFGSYGTRIVCITR